LAYEDLTLKEGLLTVAQEFNKNEGKRGTSKIKDGERTHFPMITETEKRPMIDDLKYRVGRGGISIRLIFQSLLVSRGGGESGEKGVTSASGGDKTL